MLIEAPSLSPLLPKCQKVSDSPDILLSNHWDVVSWSFRTLSRVASLIQICFNSIVLASVVEIMSHLTTELLAAQLPLPF